MKAFISTISIQTNSLTSEKITAGLLAITKDKIYFHTSSSKISIAEKLTETKVKKHIEETFHLIKNKVTESNQLLKQSKTQLLPNISIFNEDYIAYLHNYSNGLIQFGQPKPIAAVVNKLKFNSLYKQFVGDTIEIQKEKKHQSIYSKIKKQLSQPDLKSKADINYCIKPEILPGIYDDTDITLITKNGAIIALQTIDFTASTSVLVHNLSEFDVLVNSLKKLEYMKNLKKGKYYILMEEPEKKTPQYKILENTWKTKNDLFEIIEPDKLEKITAKIVDQPHMKFSEYISH